MKTEDWQKVKDILNDALELPTTDRRQFIESSCTDLNPEIRREVESLMQMELNAESFFGSLAIVNYADLFLIEDDPKTLLGTEIGNYKIIRKIGYGGMGVVYLAERNDGLFDQRVALKLLKSELNTENLRRRFQQERQILALLEHPNIARLLDAGMSPNRVPFLAMEYVEGIPIDDFCDKNGLDLEQRLELFRTVCEAMAFSHRNLVVHRDLKPSNILITKAGVPKLLDFGIAKLLSPEFDEKTQTVTKLGAMTPSYASPEQLKGESVTTATDIYSLGIILYELLAGRRPFENVEKNIQEISKAVCETDPPLPSVAAQSAADRTENSLGQYPMLFEQQSDDPDAEDQTPETIPTGGHQTSPQFRMTDSRRLRGDLDNIILKALKKEPERRYSTVENFAEDIRRYLTGLPVLARPDTFSYRAEKFIKRNRFGVFAGTLIFIVIVGGIIATLWQARIAQAERDRARLEAEKSKKINAYLQNILNFSNPHWLSSNPKRNREAKISDALDEALKNIDSELANEPEIQAEVMFTIGQTYVSQAQFDKAEPLLRRAIENFNQVSGGENLKAKQASIILGDALYYSSKYKEAEPYYTAAINYFLPKVAEDKSQTKWLAIALNQLGNLYGTNGNHHEAIKLYHQSLELSSDFTGKDRFIIPIIQGNLGTLSSLGGDYKSALNYNQQALEEIRQAGNELTIDGGNIYSSIGFTYDQLGDYLQAEVNYQKAYDILVKALGEGHFDTAFVLRRQAGIFNKQGKFVEAERIAHKSLQIVNKQFPKGHIQGALAEYVLGEIYTKRGDLKKGETILRKALDWLLQNTKNPNRNIATNKALLGENLLAQKRYSEAREMTQAAIEGTIAVLGENHPSLKKYRELLSKIPEN